jgi:hypothetical protein
VVAPPAIPIARRAGAYPGATTVTTCAPTESRSGAASGVRAASRLSISTLAPSTLVFTESAPTRCACAARVAFARASSDGPSVPGAASSLSKVSTASTGRAIAACTSPMS